MIDILYIDVPNEYVSRTDASLFVAQIVRTANEMSSTDNGTPTNKSYNNNNNNNNKTNKAMFNQKEYNKCADFEIILGVISMIVMVMIVLM